MTSHHDLVLAAVLAAARQKIDTFGWMIQATTVDSPFGPVLHAYTVGMTPAGLPELVAQSPIRQPVHFDNQVRIIQYILNELATVHVAAVPDGLQPGRLYTAGRAGDYVVDPPDPQVRLPLNMATALYGPATVRALICTPAFVCPDPPNHLPGETPQP